MIQKLINKNLIKGIKETIENYEQIKDKMKNNYHLLKSIYNWDKVVHKTMSVYKIAMEQSDLSFITRIKKILSCGHYSAFLFLCAFLVDCLFLILFTVFQPLKSIKNKTREFKYKHYIKYLKEWKERDKKNEKEKEMLNNNNVVKG